MKKQSFDLCKRTIVVLVLLLSLFAILLATGCQKKTTSSKKQEKSSKIDESQAETLKDDDYIVVGTGQNKCYNNKKAIDYPKKGEAFYGQDAQHKGVQPSYKDNGDGTVTDLDTGLIWQKEFRQVSWADSFEKAEKNRAGGFSDWRVPSIKELYSLINFSGNTGSAKPDSAAAPDDAIPFIDTNYFDFEYGQTARYIDAQYLSATEYVSTTMGGDATFFGVNFADGRIKGYSKSGNPQTGKFYVRYVRGNVDYGKNNFKSNGDGTISDKASSLMWSKADSGKGMDWEDALVWVQQKNEEDYLGHNDWRLPNAKELQSIVDYSRSPDTAGSAAIDPIFKSSQITNEAGERDYPNYWTSTTHLEGNGDNAVYVAFGRSLGFMKVGVLPIKEWIDVHGAGSQRSDPKTGDPNDYPKGRGPQGDAIRINNYIRLVRGGT